MVWLYAVWYDGEVWYDVVEELCSGVVVVVLVGIPCCHSSSLSVCICY